jgi:hypothetical protein
VRRRWSRRRVQRPLGGPVGVELQLRVGHVQLKRASRRAEDERAPEAGRQLGVELGRGLLDGQVRQVDAGRRDAGLDQGELPGRGGGRGAGGDEQQRNGAKEREDAARHGRGG